MRYFLMLAAGFFLSGVGFSASAGQFICHEFGSADDSLCATSVSQFVTEKFTTKYPAKKYAIVVIHDYQLYSSGGGVGFAVAGVVPLLTGKHADDMVLVPFRRFIATSRTDKGVSFNAYDKTDQKIKLIQQAVQSLMEACNRSPKCDVMGSVK